ncbi:phenylalanine--tRNA ligase subunit beta [Mycoplasmopsis verecunda]|uniref:Phenylalanine--tRNA ligase beta subunit n=1 Tax=Mycoplasmopsis verecunda TaxID=171291 RepID=A0A1T4KJE5_9BACT|nr:phenylalanine--tRNA ligase subunit beta [Mycoplasmopsis verecunda]WPB54248.1 phenylalanine--tRNA ligase subunit beta [Mycoplasmopsis verecunda]SJZ42539.1 phenylalanyl-tRNA synthetase beta chain [Mycoplasmopsis verecunda]
MLLSLNHLNKLLKGKDLSTAEVETALNNIGFEVEEVKPFSAVKGLLFAEVISVTQNPNSDRLDVVEVKTKNGNYTIQTNNRILKPGDLTICFPVGASKDGIVFNEVKLKGLPSQGMFASWSEIGYDWTLLSEKDEIARFSQQWATLEDDPIVKLGLDDYIIDISITANRNDANSYYVLANELAAYFNTEVTDLLDIHDVKSNLSYDIEIDSKNEVIKDVLFIASQNKGVTSLEEKMLLAKHGIDAKLPWAVNLTNLLLITMGTPTHVYDLDKLPKGELSVEKFSGKVSILGDKEIEIQDTLCICIDSKPISIAATMGLEKYKVTEVSNNFLFEIGSFNPSEIRHSAREVKMNTNSSSQASRPISKYIVKQAAKYLVTHYLSNLPHSTILNDFDCHEAKLINWDINKLATYSGALNHEQFNKAIKSLDALGFKLDTKNNVISIPQYRYDVELFEDIIEEVLRFYSYDSIQEQKLASIPLKTMQANTIPNRFVAQGYSEVRTFSLVSKEKAKFNPFDFKTNQVLQTYVSKEREVVRNSIITSLSDVAEYNMKRKMSNINIFEKGMINNNVMVYGVASSTKSFRQMQIDLINLIGKELKFVPFSDNEMIHPNASAEIIYNDNVVGWIGKLHPKFDNTNGTIYAEIFTSIFDKDSKELKFSTIDLEPLKFIDLTFELDNNDYLVEKINQIKNTAEVFDIIQIDDYKKENSHNVTLRITASDANIEKIIKKFN